MPARDSCTGLRPQAANLRATLAGELTGRVPRQEMFFNNPRIERHLIGRERGRDPVATLELALALQWGMCWAGSWSIRPGGRNDVASDGTSHYAGGCELTWAIVEQMAQAEPPPMDQTARNIALFRSEGLLAHVFMLHCFHSAATGIGMERLCMMVYDQPDLLAEYMRQVEAFNRRGLKALLDTGVAPDIAVFDADCAFKTAMMVSPSDYRRLIFEPTKATCEMLADAGITILMHTDGKIDNVYPIWLEMGVAGAHGVEKQANDLAEIKRKFGDRMTLFGNFDPVALATDMPENIREQARQMVEIGRDGGRYVAAVNTIVGENVPPENYFAFVEGVEEAASY
ncbi:MAG: uroporphyrinogen decarboxylase family protein [Armatimonadota bacterium]